MKPVALNLVPKAGIITKDTDFINIIALASIIRFGELDRRPIRRNRLGHCWQPVGDVEEFTVRAGGRWLCLSSMATNGPWSLRPTLGYGVMSFI